jgi:hypothetical protein
MAMYRPRNISIYGYLHILAVIYFYMSIYVSVFHVTCRRQSKALAKRDSFPRHLCMRVSATKTKGLPSGNNYVKFYIGNPYKNLSTQSNSGYSRT